MESILDSISIPSRICYSIHAAIILFAFYKYRSNKSNSNDNESNSSNNTQITIVKFPKVVKDQSDNNVAQANIEDYIDFIVSEKGAAKDQRLADVLSTNLPPCGIKEVFLSKDKTSGAYKLKDLLNEVKRKSENIREYEMLLLQYDMEKNRIVEDINFLKNQLEAEEQLRIQAEAKANLMHNQLEKLQKINSEHNLNVKI